MDQPGMNQRDQAKLLLNEVIFPRPETPVIPKNISPWSIGDLPTYTEDERGVLTSFQGLIADYLRLKAPPRPLCLAVFGQPGAGKSLAWGRSTRPSSPTSRRRRRSLT